MRSSRAPLCAGPWGALRRSCRGRWAGGRDSWLHVNRSGHILQGEAESTNQTTQARPWPSTDLLVAVPPEERAAFAALWKERMEAGEAFQLRTLIAAGDGGYRPCALRGIPDREGATGR